MFKNLAIKWKIATLTALLLLGLAVVGAAGLLGIRQVGAAAEEIGSVRLPSVEGLLVLSEAQTAVKAATLSAAIYENNYTAQEPLRRVLLQRQQAWKNALAGWNKYEPLPQTAEEATLWKRFTGDWDAWKRADQQLETTLTALAANTDEQVQKDLFTRYFQQYEASTALFSAAE
ncbi:MAG TPA: MCP four helix bundle domain-containing protein, partial [Burkholderiaceae bacterium]